MSIIWNTKPRNLNKYNPRLLYLLFRIYVTTFTLREFFYLPSPPEIQARRNQIHLLLYGFADASGGGLGSTVIIPGSGIRCRVGVWGKDNENETSNYKEFENVMLTVEEEARQGMVQGASMYLFTYNSTMAGPLLTGNTPSRKLFNLIVQFRKIQMSCDADVMVSHVAGTDALSCVLLNEGVTMVLDMLSFIPLHLSVIERNPQIIPWISTWLGEDAEILSPLQWFSHGHSHNGGYYNEQGFWRLHPRPGKFVWAPPPAAAPVAVEELRKDLIKRRDSTHVILCPHLLTPQWHRAPSIEQSL
jgi:hypothetical protein